MPPWEPWSFSLVVASLLLAGLALACVRPRAIVGHPVAVLCVLLAASAGAAVALLRLDPSGPAIGFAIDVDPASEPLMRRGDPGLPVYRQATKDFGNDDLFVIAMQTRNVFTPENLETLRTITNRLRALPGIASVESLTRALSVRYDAESDRIEVARLVDAIPRDAAGLADLRERALTHPIHRKTLVSGDGRTAAINVSFQPMSDAEFVELDLDGRIRALLDAEARAGQHFFIAGRPHVRAQAYHLMVRDIARLVPIAVAVAAVALWLMGGSLSGVLLPLLACSTATLWVFGAMASLGIDINLITLVLGSLMICIGSVYGVHVHARYEVIAGGLGREAGAEQAALACLRYARTPVVMAGVTTCIGFGALLLSDIPATNELGAFSILGVASVTLISLTGVPAALALLPATGPLRRPGAGDPSRSRTAASRAFQTLLDRGLGAIAGLAVGRSGAVLAAAAALTAAAVLVMPRIAIDTDVITFFLEDSRVRTDFAAVNRLLTGVVPIYVPVHGEREGAFREPAHLRRLEALQERLERVEGVSQVLSSVDLVRLANRAMHRDDPAQARIPDTRAGLAEATFLLPKAKLRRFATSDHSRANLVLRTPASGSAAVRALERRIREVLDATALPPGFAADVTGNALLLNRSADVIAGNQATQVGFAAGAIFTLICGVFRSLRVALIAMVPNVVPVVLFFGVLGAGAAPLSLPTSLIGSIALGIAIDDTMHFLVAYRARRREGMPPEEAADHCVRQVGRPIVMTSVMLVIGFLVILSSGFATLREFGALTGLTMAICLATDLLLLPALLVRLRA